MCKCLCWSDHRILKISVNVSFTIMLVLFCQQIKIVAMMCFKLHAFLLCLLQFCGLSFRTSGRFYFYCFRKSNL